ncbi:hypothetical protein FGKAn22_11700 [Ferrigenium kumadai]|uniref:Uncharacterized protein n=1 Tax=Ferrigenium kumadai TaxID=1682490 RepID=A0AAN1SYQ3_9PROT|nr:hypothetical protein [Ferrigenium kumadai]BBI99477.1 hypothetical protein FGKAn22_11700 [Ferrigenium kumadai]
MRNVSSVTSTYTSMGERSVNGLGSAHAVKPVQARGPASAAEQDRHHHDAARHERHDMPREERRKVARRVSHQPVLVELRSGVDRRRHNRREGDIVEHIDEEA